ncbi:MAG TPA: hypothetical protein VMT00_01510 [Thermoanaerobaculia bacterium]|nr:hypothetical protein [Thermoanaerobaculia bacterium]
MRPSRGFLSALAGLGVTILGWYSPWAWPAWPATVGLDLFFADFSEMSYGARAAAVVVLIALNVAVWALIAHTAWWVVRAATRSREA